MYKELNFLDDEQAGVQIFTDTNKRTLSIQMFWNYVESECIVLNEDDIINGLGLQFYRKKYARVPVSGSNEDLMAGNLPKTFPVIEKTKPEPKEDDEILTPVAKARMMVRNKKKSALKRAAAAKLKAEMNE